MNKTRKKYNCTLTDWIKKTPYWFLGFVEAEGTFGIKNLSPYFQIAQKSTNKMV